MLINTSNKKLNFTFPFDSNLSNTNCINFYYNIHCGKLLDKCLACSLIILMVFIHTTWDAFDYTHVSLNKVTLPWLSIYVKEATSIM